MKHTNLIIAALVVAGALTLSGCDQKSPGTDGKETTVKTDSAATAKGHGETEGKTCYDETGINQSPIHIRTDSSQNFSPKPDLFKPTIKASSMKFVKVSGGHPNINVEPVAVGADNSVNFYGQNYDLAQFHFHDSSEHLINGMRDSMEMHMVFVKKGTNIRIIVAVLMVVNNTAPENKFVTELWANFDKLLGGQSPTQDVYLDNTFLLVTKKLAKYYSYTGSLTSPPYQEGATFVVTTEKMYISSAQLQKFKSFKVDGHRIGEARATQPMNNRLVVYKAN